MLFIQECHVNVLVLYTPAYGATLQADKIQSRFIRYCIGKLALYG